MGMIKTEREYKSTKIKIYQFREDTKDYPVIEGESTKARLNRVANLEALYLVNQMQDELEEYENIKSGNIPDYFFEFENIGLLLIALRIKHGLNQSQLAEKLGVPPSQVSRDENNDYHGVSTTTINKILDIYGEKITLKLQK